MQPRELISFLTLAEKLKCRPRHSWTSSGKRESVAEHSWRTALMAMLCKDAFPNLNIDKVIRMCLIHDLRKTVTGDIPAFIKTQSDEDTERAAIRTLLCALPADNIDELAALFEEMDAKETDEARLYKALDNMETLISHNEAPISTWLLNEYSQNLTYGEANTAWSEWTSKLKDEVNKDTLLKIGKEGSVHPVQYGKPEDIDLWMESVCRIKDNFPGLETEQALEEHRKTVLKFMDKKQALCIKDENKIVGVILFSRSRNMICCLGVSPDQRKKGYGSLLLMQALSQLDVSKEITVTTFRQNDPKGSAPRALYRKFGFAPNALTIENGYPTERFVLSPIREVSI